MNQLIIVYNSAIYPGNVNRFYCREYLVGLRGSAESLRTPNAALNWPSEIDREVF